MQCQSIRSAPSRLAPKLRVAYNARLVRRQYHSYDHPAPSPQFSAVEESILAAAYRHVPEHGFSHRSLSLGARDAGFLDISPSVLADGVFSLIRYHLVSQRLALVKWSRELFEDEKQNASTQGVGSKVEALTRTRLMANKDVIHRWQEALAIMAQPSYVPASLKELALLSDEIWFLAGDKAVDSSWYTKRASLSMIYSSSELFMTNDTSPDFVDTRSFLSRRLDETSKIGGFVGALGTWTNFTLHAGANVLRSKGVRI